MMLKTLKTKIMLVIAMLCSSCTLLIPESTIPLRSISPSLEKNSDTLLVFLPGIGDRAEDFIDNNFLGIANDASLNGDTVVIDAHFGYYRNRTFIQRLHSDVIEPAKKKGYKNIWLVGISLGGLGALLYEMDYPNSVQGAVLIAPYLFKGPIIESIKESEGLKNWNYPSANIKNKKQSIQDAYKLWTFLQEKIKRGDVNNTYLLYGRSDKFADRHNLLAQELPSKQVVNVAGGHNWKVWKSLWISLLKKPEFTQSLVENMKHGDNRQLESESIK